jgi:hypothetical protein
MARSPPAAAAGRSSVRAICAAAGSCAGTPSTMIAVGKLIEHRPARSLRMGDVRNAPTRCCTKLSPTTIRVAAKRTVPLCGGRSTRIRAHSSCRTAGSIAKRWPVSTRVVREALSGSAPCHLGIRRAVLVDVAAAGLGFHVDIRVHRVFARYARTDFQHRRVHRAAVL